MLKSALLCRSYLCTLQVRKTKALYLLQEGILAVLLLQRGECSAQQLQAVGDRRGILRPVVAWVHLGS